MDTGCLSCFPARSGLANCSWALSGPELSAEGCSLQPRLPWVGDRVMLWLLTPSAEVARPHVCQAEQGTTGSEILGRVGP